MGAIKVLLKQIWKLCKKGDDERIGRQMPVPGARYESDITYMEKATAMQQLNLYYPESYNYEKDGKLPTIIDIHGGGWMHGDKELNQRYCEYLASQGYCVMGMTYTLLPNTDLQGMVQDVFASIHWLERYGEIRGFDLSKVLLTGDSAGGHLTSLAICIQNSKKLQQIYGVTPLKFDFSAAAICNGVCELHDIYSFTGGLSKSIDKEMNKMYLGKRGKNAPWKNYMSFSQVVTEAEKLPPIFVISSETDPFYEQTKWLIENLKKYNCEFETMIWRKEDGVHLGHVFQVAHWEWIESKITNQKMLEFFQRVTGK